MSSTNPCTAWNCTLPNGCVRVARFEGSRNIVKGWSDKQAWKLEYEEGECSGALFNEWTIGRV